MLSVLFPASARVCLWCTGFFCLRSYFLILFTLILEERKERERRRQGREKEQEGEKRQEIGPRHHRSSGINTLALLRIFNAHAKKAHSSVFAHTYSQAEPTCPRLKNYLTHTHTHTRAHSAAAQYAFYLNRLTYHRAQVASEYPLSPKARTSTRSYNLYLSSHVYAHSYYYVHILNTGSPSCAQAAPDTHTRTHTHI